MNDHMILHCKVARWMNHFFREVLLDKNQLNNGTQDNASYFSSARYLFISHEAISISNRQRRRFRERAMINVFAK